MVKKRITKAEKKRSRSAVFWVVTAIATASFFASMNSIMINQGDVNSFVWTVLISSIIAIILLIVFKWWTTSETLAFKK
jgi:uncharacterized integral membrane protein